MSWIGRKIYEYLKECEDYKKDIYGGYQPKDKLDTSNPPINELPNFKHTPPEPERKPFENFKNNRKKMKKEVRHEETCIITSVENEGIVTITIEPKKGFDVCDVSLSVGTGETPKKPVLPKELLNPKPELQAQFDTLAKLIATRDYYNGGVKLDQENCLFAIAIQWPTDNKIRKVTGSAINYYVLKFKSEEIALMFLDNFRLEIESVKHLIVK